MLIEKVSLLSAEKNAEGYLAEIEFETADGLDIGGPIQFDHEWNYRLGFLNTFVNTDEDKHFVNEVLSSEDFRNDLLTYLD